MCSLVHKTNEYMYIIVIYLFKNNFEVAIERYYFKNYCLSLKVCNVTQRGQE